MKFTCLKEIEAAIQRALKKGEGDQIEQRLISNLRELARTDKAFQTMTQAERLQAAAEMAIKQDTVTANKAAQRKALSAAAQVREVANLRERSRELGGKHPLHEALFERLRQVDSYVTGVKNEIFGRVMDTIHAAEPRFLGLIENPEANRDFIKEVYGVDTGNEIAKKGAKAYVEQMEEIRQRRNAAGENIGKLDYAYLPQPHDTGAIIKAGKEGWVSKVLPLIDRNRYLTPDGVLLSDVKMHEFLTHAYDTLSTEGLTRQEPGQMGTGSRAARNDDAHRSLHFNGPDGYMGYMRDFGQGSVFEAIHNHVNMQGKQIGMLEQFGANPNATYRLLRDTAQIEDSRAAGKAVKGFTKWGATTDMVWDVLNGTTANPVNPRYAAIGRAVRNWTSATKLGGIMLSSINDAPTWFITAKHNGLPLGDAFKTFFKSIASGSIEEDAARMGMAVESMSGEMQAWHTDNMRQDWTSKLAQTTMKLQFVEAWTHRLRAGLGLMLQDQLAKMKASNWEALSHFDQERMKTAGVTERDWQVWQAATPEHIRGRDLLTANAIRDIATAPNAPAKGMVRYYHGGSPEGVTGSLWFTSSLQDAEGWSSRSKDMKMWYVDVPENHPARGGDPQFGIIPPSRMELPAEIANKRAVIGQANFTDAEINSATAKMLGFIDNEGKTGILAPDLITRATITQGAKAGTIGGEIGRSLMLFKSFPLAVVVRNVDRINMIARTKGTGAAFRYSLSLLTGLTLFGALSIELKDLVAGKDPRDAATGKFWGAAFAQGGGLGIFGDILYTGLGGNARGGQPNWTSLAGPVAGTAADLANVTLGNLGQSLQGKDTKAAAELLRFGRQNLPFLNLWYLKSAIDHAGFNELQEWASPGYLSRQRAAASKDWGSTYWWEPEQTGPARLPNLSSAVGNP